MRYKMQQISCEFHIKFTHNIIILHCNSRSTFSRSLHDWIQCSFKLFQRKINISNNLRHKGNMELNYFLFSPWYRNLIKFLADWHFPIPLNFIQSLYGSFFNCSFNQLQNGKKKEKKKDNFISKSAHLSILYFHDLTNTFNFELSLKAVDMLTKFCSNPITRNNIIVKFLSF